jgi:branched-chain amino acid transport system substrate-binding protein
MNERKQGLGTVDESRMDYVTCSNCGHKRNLCTDKVCEFCGQSLKKNSRFQGMKLGVIAILVVGFGAFSWYFSRKPAASPDASSSITLPSSSNASALNQSTSAVATSTRSPTQDSSPRDVADWLSEGERFLFASRDPAKQSAAAALKQGNFAAAIPQLEALRQKYRNDPEVLIYLNNARLGTSPAVTAAVVVPASDTPGVAQELLRGVAQLQEEYNASRGGSLPIRLAIADDGNDPQRARDIARALAADERIRFAIGHGTSATSLAAAPIYSNHQLAMVAPTSTSTELTQAESGRHHYIYRTIPNDRVSGMALAYYLARGHHRNLAIFYNSQNSYSNSLKAAIATTWSRAGGQVSEEIDLAQPAAGVSRVGRLNADAIALIPDSQTFEQAIAVAKANRNRLPIIAGDAMYRAETLQQAGRALQGAVLPVPWYPSESADPSFPERAEFLWGGDVNWRTALSFDAARVLEALVQAGATSRADMVSRLSGGELSVTGVTGTIQFQSSGDRDGPVVLVKIEPGTRSKTGFDFVPVR